MSIEVACKDGHLDVLDWWKFSKLPLKYTPRSINQASELRRIDVWNWWKSSGLQPKYTNATLIEWRV
ncbi:hypothetical protein BJ742DRAFT_830951 [Cladochytrium replicatum]|nr:hypothetical protein BJ742DRAFT_830951 [Cladochytrium replicatum]